MEPTSEMSPRLVACLVAGKDAGDAYPSLVKYLQLGLTAEHIDVLRVMLQGESPATLHHGAQVVLEDRPLAWPLSHWSRRALVEQVRRKLESMQRGAPLVVHSLGPGAASVGAAIAESTGSELIVTVSSLAQAAEAGSARYFRKSAAIFCLSERIRDALPASISRGKRVEVVRVGITATEDPPAFSDPARAPVLLYAGPLLEEYGLDCLLRAIKVALLKKSDLLAFLVGKGPAEDGLRRLAESLEIQANVTFTGRLDDWRAVLKAADILVLPSAGSIWREEGLVAMGAGVCVIAMEGCICDGLNEGGAALHYPRGDDALLAQRLSELISDPAASRRRAAAGQEFVRVNHSPANMIDAHVRLYRSMTDKQQTLAFPSRA